MSDGYEATTVEQIAAGVGMSERTFFRYFPSKEALVLGRYEDLAASLSAALAARPADEAAWVSLRRTFDDLVTESDAEAEAGRTRGMRAVVESTDALRAGYLARMERVRESVAEVLAERLASPATASADAPGLHPATAPAVVGAAFSCLSVAYSAVTRDGGSSRPRSTRRWARWRVPHRPESRTARARCLTRDQRRLPRLRLVLRCTRLAGAHRIGPHAGHHRTRRGGRGCRHGRRVDSHPPLRAEHLLAVPVARRHGRADPARRASGQASSTCATRTRCTWRRPPRPRTSSLAGGFRLGVSRGSPEPAADGPGEFGYPLPVGMSPADDAAERIARFRRAISGEGLALPGPRAHVRAGERLPIQPHSPASRTASGTAQAARSPRGGWERSA
ncbi:hypothetical protein GCM10025876_16350 [Demequina litorisediminis]|uniref:HTH tetR-type domain-containing protein n=1 Tax=Demequina litorisediminis TaxID=1849022 RepID=A0ABQ6IE14_9MICO|nr:hypothetical protein GCM10025876_16350 [Demequina litorisediminis]